MKPDGIDNTQRIIISKDELLNLENQISQQAHIKWYTFVRPHLSGRVLVCACGVGYGCYIIRKNPNVKSVLGVDHDKATIDFADRNYSSGNTFFVLDKIKTLDHVGPFDYMVSIGTLEYLENPADLLEMAQRVQVNKIILTYPAVGSTCFNEPGCNEFALDDVKELFAPVYTVNDVFDYLGEVEFVFLERKAPEME